MNFISIFMIIIGILLIMIGMTIVKKTDVLYGKLNVKYIRFKIFVNILVGAISIITGIMESVNNNMGNTLTKVFFIVVILAILSDMVLKRVYK